MKITLLIITQNIDLIITSSLKIFSRNYEVILINTGRKKFNEYSNVKIFNKKFENNFSSLRNFAKSKANGDWILVLDSDERISEEDINKIIELIQSNDYEGYWFKRRWYIDQKRYLHHGLFYPDYQLRLFRNNPKYTYSHRVHEEINIPKSHTAYTDITIHHYGSLKKYLSWKGFTQLITYIQLAKEDYKELNHTSIWYIWKSCYTFFDMFLIALLRGKGILDGWIGIKAHFFFALSIAKAYWEAIW